MSVKVQSEDFDIGGELAALTDGNMYIGGMVSFVGLVRDLRGDDALKAMTLEHYPGMTEKMLREIEAEANERWDLEASLMVHRYGRLEPGDRIVLVATASAHRQEAFDACAFLIDWLKTKAPFWKLEESDQLGAQWVESKETDDRAAERWERDHRDAAEKMGDVVNLRAHRKQRKNVEKAAKAAANRQKHGRTKTEIARDKMEDRQRKEHLDGSQIDDES